MEARPHLHVIDVEATPHGNGWTVNLGELLGTTHAPNISSIHRAARNHAYLSGVIGSDDAQYRVTVKLPIRQDLAKKVDAAHRRHGDRQPSLTALRREVVRRLYDLGYTQSEIAVVLGFTHQGIAKLLNASQRELAHQ
jgi:DNA-binding CsgD family transcriptional regulator